VPRAHHRHAGCQVARPLAEQGRSAALTAAFQQAGAFPLPANSLDAAITASLAAGSYTAQVGGANGSSGVALLEVYDRDPGAAPGSRLVNLSARGMAGSGANVLIAGFVINGTTSEKLLIRAVGPSLPSFPPGGALADPQLKIYDTNGNVVGANDDWGGSAALGAAFTSVGAFPLPAGSKDAAVLVTLGPGIYTVQVSGVNSTTGVAMVEVYEVP